MARHDAHSSGGDGPSGDVDAAATRGHSAADPAAAPKPRGRKRTCEHGAPGEPRPKAASCRKCAAERKALSRWRGNCEAKPKVMATPTPRDGLSIADEHRAERKLLALWTKHYVAMWKSIGASSVSAECVRAQLERARGARALELRETPKRCIAPLWKAMPGLVSTPYPSTSVDGVTGSRASLPGKKRTNAASQDSGSVPAAERTKPCLVLADPFCGALAVFKSWHGAAETAHRACARLEAFREGDEPEGDHEPLPLASLPLRAHERVPENIPESVSRFSQRRAPDGAGVVETTETHLSKRGSSSRLAFAARFRNLASWRCGDRVSWTRRASFHRRRGLLAASGGAFFRKDALDPYDTPLGVVDRKKKTAASEAFSLDDDEKDDEKDGAKDETRFELSMVDHRRLGFVFEPPAVAADAAFARFVAHRARFCAVLLPSDWVEDADAPWRAEAWAFLKSRGACAVVPTSEPLFCSSAREHETTLDDDDDDAAVEPRSDDRAFPEGPEGGRDERTEDHASAREISAEDGIARGGGARFGGGGDVSGAKRTYAWLVVFRDAQARESACPDEKFWEV